jgi:hypothetical protein
MNEYLYEYRLDHRDPRTVQVRRIYGTDENPLNWRLYLVCDSEEHAEYVLRLLQLTEQIETVRE